MRVYCLDIPDDMDQIPLWLEQQLVGTELGALVAELAAVHPSAGAAPQNVRDLLGGQADQVLSAGLSGVPPQVIQKLLTQPRLLLELQEWILTEGGEYWEDRLALSPAINEIVDRGKSHLDSWSNVVSAVNVPSLSLPAARPPWYAHPLAVCLATAASLLVAIFFFERTEQRALTGGAVASKWGWNKPGAMQDDVTAAEYLNRLADGAGDWFKKRPTASAEVARRILEFRQGCSALILAEHKPLAAQDRQWLVERCRKWAAALDQQVADLESGHDALEVRNQADTTVRKLIDALHERAKSV